jgi:hypothetical protein
MIGRGVGAEESPENGAPPGPSGGRVTDGLVLLAAWLEFLALLAVLGYLLVGRRDP